MKLSDEGTLPLCSLEGILHEEYLNSSKALIKVNAELHRFRTRNW